MVDYGIHYWANDDFIIEDGKAKPKEVNMEEKDEKFVYFSMSYNITTKL